MNTKPFAIIALATATSMLVACGGSSSRPTLTVDEPDRMLPDPQVVRLEGILEQSDTLLVPSIHYSLSVEGIPIDGDRTVERVSCTGASCTGDDETELSVQDLIDSFDQIRSAEVDIGSRSGFDTAIFGTRFEVSEIMEGVTLSTAPSASIYGFWGEHGFGTADVAGGPISGSIQGTPFAGDFGTATAYAGGNAAGTNPTGMGSATWSGVAEAASTGDFQRHQGSATVTIADLSRPRVGVEVDISGHDIGLPAWADMPLVDGGFTSGDVDTGDYLAGNFHGPDHSETYGVFDTGNYVGAFGAKRNP